MRLFGTPTINSVVAMYGYKNDGKFYLYYADGLYLLNAPFHNPRYLQDLCWDAIIDHPRVKLLTSYTSTELHEIGIPQKFHRSIFW